MMRQAVLYSILVPSLITLSAWSAQSEDPQPMLELHSVGLYGRPVAEKDQAMFDTIKMFKARLMDLADELDFEPFQGQAMMTGWDLLTSQTAISLSMNDQGPSVSLVFAPGDVSTESLYTQLTGFADMADLGLSELSPTSSEIQGPIGPIGFAYDQSKVWLNMGEGEPASLDIPQGDLPAGVTPILSGRIDIGTMIQTFAPPDMLEEFQQQLEAAGPLGGMNPVMAFLSPDAPAIEFGVGVNEHEMHMTTRLIGAADQMEALGLSNEFSFNAEMFRRIPYDTVRLSAFQTNIGSTLEAIEMVLEDVGSDEYAQFSEDLGVDLIDDVLAKFGDRGMFYQSESTGGGGLLSAVMMFELNDAPGFGNAHQKLVEKINELAAAEVDGYARIQSRDIGGIHSFTMTTPGLPIPIEPSWAITNDSLIIALSPGALEVAVGQQYGAGESILENPSFQKAVLSRMPGGKAHAINYFDAPRLARKGYGMTSMLTSAIANAARSPKNPDRVVGSIMPAFNSFVDDIEPSGSVSWWDGDDYRMHVVGDESSLVQLSVAVGTIADVQGLVVPALAAGVLLPALDKAQERANSLKSATTVRSLTQGVIIYASNNNDQFPDSIKALVDEGVISEDMLESPFGPAADGGEDYAIRLGMDYESAMFDARFVIAIDRAMVLSGEDHIPVGFADAHVNEFSFEELIELLSRPENEGAANAFDLDWVLAP